MTDPRYRIPADELLSSAQVPRSEQVETQSEPEPQAGDWSTGLNPYGDGMSGDVDGDGD